MSDSPALVAAAHGTRDPAGRTAIDLLRAEVAGRRPGLDVVEAYVDEDVQRPGLSAVLAGLDAAIVVPLLLSAGYHVHVDVAEAIAAANRPGVRAARPLGPDAVLAEVLADRLAEAGVADHAIVLAAAGSSDPRAATDVERMADLLAARLGRRVTAAYATAGRPAVGESVDALHAAGTPVAIASYLLGPGSFHDRLRTVGAEVVAAPLLPDARLAELVLRRYDEAAATAG
ncbi:MAG TPA: CbiX/SirB N-terminal domain-containing protein [Jiangellales bacterium]|nr:CbiX/SirB N-terminal domain-containing protein [Jiangellales bacterium]